MAKDKRFEIRCSQVEFESWTEKSKGFGTLSEWSRKLMNDAPAFSAKSQTDWESPKESKADEIAARLGVTKGGEILEKPEKVKSAPVPIPKKKFNLACQSLGHAWVYTNLEEKRVACTRCGATGKMP